MINDGIDTTPTCDLMLELSQLEKKIDLMIMKYELIREELIKRFPSLEESESFQSKIKK